VWWFETGLRQAQSLPTMTGFFILQLPILANRARLREIAVMRSLIFLATAFSLSLPANAAPRGFNSAETEQLRCVAALAIVAHEQGRPTGEYADFEQVANPGARFAEVAGQNIVKTSGQSREAVRDKILAEVEGFQKAYPGDQMIPDKTITGCIALMNRVAPAPPPPDIVRCAALIGLAQTEMQRREGMSPTTSKLAVYAALLTGQARDKLLADGRTQNESDMILGTTRDALLEETAVKQAAGESAEQDFEACFALANPPKKPHSTMQTEAKPHR
jgi:hypothetical protein